jgi:hypothetical protein
MENVMKSNVTLTNTMAEQRIFTPGEITHVCEFLCKAYRANKEEWGKQKVTVLQAVKLAMSQTMYFEELEKKLFKGQL